MERPVAPLNRRYSIGEYFELEASSDAKHEFSSGGVVDMAGGTPFHSLITANVIASVGTRIAETPCRIFDSNLLVQIYRTVRYSYPDATVVCGPLEFAPEDAHRMTITNPKLIFEVLSPSTEASDRGEKFAAYLRCPSLQEYVLVSQHKPRVECYYRQNDGTWSFTYFEAVDATARLRSLNIDLPLTEVYAKVDFPPPPPEPSAEAPPS